MQAEATLDDNDKNSQEKYELTMANDHFGNQNMSRHLDLGVNMVLVLKMFHFKELVATKDTVGMSRVWIILNVLYLDIILLMVADPVDFLQLNPNLGA
jgi:hypothetical protein